MNLEFQTKDYSASDIVKECMTDFTIDVALQKVASVIDGLKSIHRRILWAMGTNEKWMSLNTFVGKVIEIHPVGDKSINEACVRCMQEHSMGIPLLKGKGNTGGYDNNDAGADRYLKVMISPIAKDLFFDGVNLDTLPMKETEDFMNVEPVYFIPRLPTTLLLYSLTLGVGFKSEIFPINLDNVCVLVQKFLEHKAKFPNVPMDYSKLAHHFVPDFPIKNVIRNFESVVASYSRGQFTPQIQVDGFLDVFPNSVVVRTAPFGTPFENVEIKLRAMLQDKKSWIADLCTGFSNMVHMDTEGALTIAFKRGVDTFDVAYKLIKDLSLTRGLRSIPQYVTRNGCILTRNPPQLIDLWYKVRKDSILGGIKNDQISTTKQIIERQTKLLVYDQWDEVFGVIRNENYDPKQVLDELMQRFDLSFYQAKYLANSPIISANKKSREILQDEIVALEKKALVLKESTEHVDQIMYRDTEYFRKKYHRPRLTKITPYIGYVCINEKHIVQFDSFEEGQDLLERFPGSKIHFYQDNKKMPTQFIISEGSLTTPKMRLPKMFPGNIVIEAPEGKIYTLCLTGSTASVVDGIHHHKADEKNTLIAVGRNFIGLLPDGTIKELSINDLTHRKGVGRRGGKSELIYAIPSCLGDVVLFHMNTIDPTALHLNYVSAGETKKIPLSVLGETEFLGVMPAKTKTSWMFNIPSFAHANFQYVTIEDISKLINGTKNLTIPISRKAKRDPKIRTSMLI